MPFEPKQAAAEIRASLRLASDSSVAVLRKTRQVATRRLKPLGAVEVLRVAEALLGSDDLVPRWFVYELIHHHGPALASLDADALARLGRGMSTWGDVDPFACYLAGVAWREGQITDSLVQGWARSSDRWWRRAAVVSTVPLNSAARGGHGDAERTLAICDTVRADRDEMVVKACSWALRELSKRDRAAVQRYVTEHADELPARVLREVRHKLDTGLKNPRRTGP